MMKGRTTLQIISAGLVGLKNMFLIKVFLRRECVPLYHPRQKMVEIYQFQCTMESDSSVPRYHRTITLGYIGLLLLMTH